MRIRTSKDMYVLVGIVGTLLILASLYAGWSLSVAGEPLLTGWIGGALPTIFAIIGTFCLSFAFKKEPPPAS